MTGRHGRRTHITTLAGLLLFSLSKKGSAVTASSPTTPATTPSRGSGRAGEFDFLAGRWSIKNRRLKQRWQPVAKQEWETFDGDSHCWTVLGGLGSIEELRIPVGQPRGMGLRLLDSEKGLWSDYWVASGTGQIVPPPMWGEFKDGAGTFISTDERDGDIAIRSRGVWDRITSKSCRWHQAFSRDAGKTWEENWYMDWTRIGPS